MLTSVRSFVRLVQVCQKLSIFVSLKLKSSCCPLNFISSFSQHSKHTWSDRRCLKYFVYLLKIYFCKFFLLSGQEHPHVLNKHIPEKYWQHSSENDQKSVADDGGKRMFSCPLKCSSSFDDKVELLAHFKSVHGFSDDIIQKVLRAHPTLSGPLAVMEGAKKVEA